ncbi:MAG: CTP synthase [Clostridiaceae bacterium]|nr:CTP synthase [Clostridiaceae bacterium]
MKYIFVTGGVVSGLGKGVVAASLGRLLKEKGYKIAAQKLDPYINVDPGTMSPLQHGEVFVTEDGAETDLDLGHYERFIDENLNKYSNLTSGKVYWNVLNKERRGEYLGQTVQVIPHITDEIKSFIYNVGRKNGSDIVITEIGGTTGDIESQPFLEAARQVSLEVGKENCMFIHVVLIPQIPGSDEYKTKPAQHSVKGLQGQGIFPDILVARLDGHLDEGSRSKLALFCNMQPECIVESTTVPVLYEAPLMLEESGFSVIVSRRLGLVPQKPDMTEWMKMVQRIISRERRIKIALVGKYISLHDAYLSVAEALHHAGYENNTYVDIKWVDSECVNDENADQLLGDCDGVLVPGGFGNRGIEGKISACRWARINNVPYLGICLGMQIAVIEYARSVLGLEYANSGEFDENSRHKVIDLMPDQQGNIPKGGTMRLGKYPCHIMPGSMMDKAYGEPVIFERHRHRYEFNNDYREAMESNGLCLTGLSPDGHLVEAVEIPKNDFFVGVQYHPEFKSRPNKAHPLFREFVKAAVRDKE